jgi:hypothetical protein
MIRNFSRSLQYLAVLVFAGLVIGATFPVLALADTIGPYTVEDAIVQDTTLGQTTATYTITVPADVKDLSHLALVLPVCADERMLTIDGGGLLMPSDPSTGTAGPLIKWDLPQRAGTTTTYSYTVSGIWQPVQALLILKAQSAFSGPVDAIGCEKPPPVEPPVTPEEPVVTPPVVTTTEPAPQVVTSPLGLTPPTQIVLGERVVPGRARLIGPGGCRYKPFTVRVVGRRMAGLTFRLDGKVVKRYSRRANTYRLRVDPVGLPLGVHRLVATVRFVKATPKAQTYRLSFQRCSRRMLLPQFTG